MEEIKTKMKKGFTLVELLVVIAIVAILATVILVSVASQRQNARQLSVLQTTNSLLPAVVQCQLQKNAFTGSTLLRFAFDNALDTTTSGLPAGVGVCSPEISTQTPVRPSFCSASSFIAIHPSGYPAMVGDPNLRGSLYIRCVDTGNASTYYDTYCCYEGRDTGRCTTNITDLNVAGGDMQCF